MRAASISGADLKKGILCLTEKAKLFHGMTPDQMARMVRSNGLGKKLPTNKEQMALLVHVVRMVKHNPAMIDMIREVKSDSKGVVSIMAGNVNNNDMDKQKKVITPQSELSRIGDMLKRGL